MFETIGTQICSYECFTVAKGGFPWEWIGLCSALGNVISETSGLVFQEDTRINLEAMKMV